ncbi:alpha/beta fold hydrolase [Veronia pacifica]|nr:alpha/beta hydrolase [Veronia pacifica]
MNQLTPWNYTLRDGVVIRGHRTEPTGKPVIHFLHGTGLSGLTYWPMLSALTDEFDIFIQDVQGHGDSDSGDRFWGWDNNAAVCREVWQSFSDDYRGCTKIGMGHSFGGILTLLMQDQDAALFDRLVLLDPVIFPPVAMFAIGLLYPIGFTNINPLVNSSLNRRNGWSSYGEALNYFSGRGMFKYWDPSAVRAYVDYALAYDNCGQVTLKCDPTRESEVFGTAPKRIWRPINKIDVKTTILYGEQSYWFVKKSMKRLTSKGEPFDIVNLKGGHCFMQEAPEDTAIIIKDRIHSSFEGNISTDMNISQPEATSHC